MILLNIIHYKFILILDLQVESSENYNSVARARLRMQVNRLNFS